MEPTVFTPTQMHLLRMFQYMKTEEDLLEMKEVLSRYYASKMDERIDELWDKGILNQDRLDEINRMDLHKMK